MLLDVICFLSLGVYACVGCCDLCPICDALSRKCWYIGSMLVSSCSCMLLSCVHPVVQCCVLFVYVGFGCIG